MCYERLIFVSGYIKTNGVTKEVTHDQKMYISWMIAKTYDFITYHEYKYLSKKIPGAIFCKTLKDK